VRETTLQTPRSVKKEEGGGARDARAESPEMGVKLSPGSRERLREGVLRSGFISHYPTPI